MTAPMLGQARRATAPTARVISLGAGVQSSTLALMAATGAFPERIDFAVFADTQAEPPSVYTWLKALEAMVAESRHPFPIIKATKGSLRDASLQVLTSKTSGKRYLKSLIPAFVLRPGGEFGRTTDYGILGRRCTRDYKLRVIFRETRKRLGYHGRRMPEDVWVEQLIGISTDEATRMKPSREDWATNRWPLIEMGMSRQDCLDHMARLGLRPPRSACTFCPYHSPEEWRRLRDEEPEAYAEAVCFEGELQEAASRDEVIDGMPFLTRLGPLGSIDWDELEQTEPWQLDLFGNECEGMCGV